MNSSKILEALKQCCGVWADYSQGCELIFIPRVGKHIIIYGMVTLDDYNNYLCNTDHYNLCGDDKEFPELGVNDEATLVWWLDNDNMVHFNKYIPCKDMRGYPLSAWVKGSDNHDEMDRHFQFSSAQGAGNGEFYQCFYVRELNMDAMPPSSLFFATDEPESMNPENYLPTSDYVYNWYNSVAYMCGYGIERGDMYGAN